MHISFLWIHWLTFTTLCADLKFDKKKTNVRLFKDPWGLWNSLTISTKGKKEVIYYLCNPTLLPYRFFACVLQHVKERNATICNKVHVT